MRKLLCTAFLAAVVLSLGCAITDYPVITDTRGADANGVLVSFYDKAYIVPVAGQAATLWEDGTEENYTQLTQDWKGDQWLYTYVNFDPTGAVQFLDQTYCDPVRQTNCSIITAWNPDLPNAYPHGDQNAGYDNADDPFDYVLDENCAGLRSLSYVVSLSTREGDARGVAECGSAIWADKQSAAYEFSLLETVNFRGRDYYHLPIDNSVAAFSLVGQDGAQGQMPVFGRFNAYIDRKLRTVFQVTPNARFQLRWIDNWVATHGNYIDVDATYGSLTMNYKVNVTTMKNALDRI